MLKRLSLVLKPGSTLGVFVQSDLVILLRRCGTRSTEEAGSLIGKQVGRHEDVLAENSLVGT